MREHSTTANIHIILDKLHSFYVINKTKFGSRTFYFFSATPEELIELTQLAVESNTINFIFEIPHNTLKERRSFFTFIMEKCKLNAYSKQEDFITFETIISLFIRNGLDCSIMSLHTHELPSTIFSKTIKIQSTYFFQLMLNKSVVSTLFFKIITQMNNEQLYQICVELAEMSYDKMAIAASLPQFYEKLSLFLMAIAEKNLFLETSIKQKLKTTILLFSEVTENIQKERYKLQNPIKEILILPFKKELINIYTFIQSSILLLSYFSDDTLFLNCVKKNNFLPWIRNNEEHINWKFFSEILLQAYSQEKFMQTIVYLTQLGVMHNLIKLREISIQSSKESWVLYANRLIRMTPYQITDISKLKTPALPDKNQKDDLSQILLGYRAHSILGRTIIFTNDGNYIALKVQKKEEDVTALEKEFSAMQIFGKKTKKLALQSDVPTPLGVYLLRKIDIIRSLAHEKEADQEALMTLTSLNTEFLSSETISCLIYTVKNYNYFTYLHNETIPSQDFSAANEKIIIDLVTTLKQGIIFDRLADIFHTQENTASRTDSGRYLVLVALLRRHHAIHLNHSSGRVDRWQEAIRYVNLRASGLADLGDYCESELFYQKSWFQEINQAYTSPEDMFSGNYVKHDDADPDFKSLIVANTIAEYLFILTLLCGKRAINLLKTNTTLSNDEKLAIWTGMAEQVVNNASLMIHLLTPLSKKNTKNYLLSFISIDRLARQMQYWMAPDYVMDFNEGMAVYQKKLSDLYDPETIVTFNIAEVTSSKKPVQYVEGVGLSVDGINQDLGAFNAQNPMKEDNKIYYMAPALINLLNSLTQNFRNAFEQFEAAIIINHFKNALDAIQSLKLNSFPHSTWQKKCVASCYAKVLRAAHPIVMFSNSAATPMNIAENGSAILPSI